jgi:hypothetical protein
VKRIRMFFFQMLLSSSIGVKKNPCVVPVRNELTLKLLRRETAEAVVDGGGGGMVKTGWSVTSSCTQTHTNTHSGGYCLQLFCCFCLAWLGLAWLGFCLALFFSS